MFKRILDIYNNYIYRKNTILEGIDIDFYDDEVFYLIDFEECDNDV